MLIMEPPDNYNNRIAHLEQALHECDVWICDMHVHTFCIHNHIHRMSLPNISIQRKVYLAHKQHQEDLLCI